MEKEKVLCNSFSKEDAFKALDTINMWINNCDNKASIILGSIGVITSIMISSDFAKVIKNIIKSVFMDIELCKIIYFIISLIAFLICMTGVASLVVCIVPTIILNKSKSKKVQKRFLKINKNKKDKQIVVNTQSSLMFYGIIATTEYDEFYNLIKSNCDNFDNVMADLTFQIHSASVICKLKFERLKRGIILFIFGFLICFVLVIIGYCSFLN